MWKPPVVNPVWELGPPSDLSSTRYLALGSTWQVFLVGGGRKLHPENRWRRRHRKKEKNVMALIESQEAAVCREKSGCWNGCPGWGVVYG